MDIVTNSFCAVCSFISNVADAFLLKTFRGEMSWPMVPGSMWAATKRSRTGVTKQQVRMAVDLMTILTVGNRAYYQVPLLALLDLSTSYSFSIRLVLSITKFIAT